MKNESYSEPIKVLDSLDIGEAEMTGGQLAFLCGLIKQYRPRKLVEVGVAAGGTSAVILQCISLLDYDTQVFSLDLSSDYYRDPHRRTGYLIDEYKKLDLCKAEHKLLTGKYAVEFLDIIGHDVDFLILDTMHSLPGEMLDFLAFYPLLKQGSVVVLHDIVMNHLSRSDFDAYATKILFDTIVAEKIVDFGIEDGFPNIGAFVINNDTKNYIGNVFSAMTITWKYNLNVKTVQLYRKVYEKYYPAAFIRLFDEAVRMNSNTLSRRNIFQQQELIRIMRHVGKLMDKNVYVYGCGHIGKQIYYILEECGIRLKGYIVSDGERKTVCNDRIYYLSEVNLNKESDLVYVGVNEGLQQQICKELRKRHIDDYLVPDSSLLKYVI